MRLGLIGCPISHSKSPALFLEHYASRPDILEHWSYDLIERDTFDEAWAAFLQDYIAVNVTAPFKEDAFKAPTPTVIQPSDAWPPTCLSSPARA